MDSELLIKQIASIVYTLSEISDKISLMDRKIERMLPSRNPEKTNEQIIITEEDYE